MDEGLKKFSLEYAESSSSLVNYLWHIGQTSRASNGWALNVFVQAASSPNHR